MREPAPEKGASNIGEYSVSEVSQAVKRTVEDAFGYVRVRGEISGFRGQHGSGHAYFSMKDERARLEAVIWKGVYNRLKVKPEEGLEVIATGKITTYPGSSKYQIVIESLEPAGVGALMALLEERKKKLAAEGLFDPARKQLLPYLPRVIGVITSPTGAVIRDIMHRLDDRFPTHVLLWPVRVQGETCGDEVANAIRGFNALPEAGPMPRPDLLIVARGGGSLEDLWGFNDEAVVRAAAASDIPLISAVGHETDWTLIDYAADERAPTPTGAAEMAVPVRADLLATLDDLARRHHGALTRGIDQRRTNMRALSRALPSLSTLLAMPRQRLDEAANRLPLATRNQMRDLRARLERASGRISLDTLSASLALSREKLTAQERALSLSLANRASRERDRLSNSAVRLTPLTINKRIADARRETGHLTDRAVRAQASLLKERRARLDQLSSVLNLVSYQATLARGFALVRDGDGQPVRSCEKVAKGAAYQLEFADGKVGVMAMDGPPKPEKKLSPKPKATGAPRKQGSLF